jgi:hypothetical protein
VETADPLREDEGMLLDELRGGHCQSEDVWKLGDLKVKDDQTPPSFRFISVNAIDSASQSNSR